MKKYIRILAILLSLLLLTSSFAACGRTEKGDKDDEGDYGQVSETSQEASDEDESEDVKEADQTDSGDEAEEDSAVSDETVPSEESEEVAEGNAKEDADENQAEASVQSAPAASSEKPGDVTGVEADEVMGVFNGNTYTNEFFKLSLKFPADWTILTRDQLVETYKLGTEFIKESSSNSDVIDVALAQVVPLFLVSRHPLDYMEGTNFNINGVAENISLAKGLIKSPRDYITLAAGLMSSQGIESKTGETADLEIGGRQFAKVDVVLTTNGVNVDQTMYVTLEGDHVIIFTLTYYSEEEKQQLEDILSTISFK